MPDMTKFEAKNINILEEFNYAMTQNKKNISSFISTPKKSCDVIIHDLRIHYNI